MKHSLVRLAGLLIVAAIVLSGCNLIGTDRMMELDQQLAALKEKYSGVVATYDGGEITQADVMGSFVSQSSYWSQLYAQYYGVNMTEDMLDSIKESVVEGSVRDVAIAKELESRGLSLSEDKLAEVQASADDMFQQAYDSFYASAEGKGDDVRAKQTEYDMASNGYTKESFYNIELAEARYELIEETLRAEITEVTDEQLKEAYDEKVSEDEESYTETPGSVGSAMTSEDDDVYWFPEGYRTVKHILIVPDDEVLTAVKDARTALTDGQKAVDTLQDELDALNDDDAEEAAEEPAEAEETEAEPAEAEESEAESEEAEETEAEEPARTAEQIQAEIDEAQAKLPDLQKAVEEAEAACLASQQEKIDEIYQKLEDGEDFEALIEAYGEDPGMQNEPTKTRGYYVCSASTNWDANFTAGAMLLEKVGDVSKTPVIGGSGIHIIRYESDVQPGAVALDDVHDKLYDETLEDMKTEHFEEALDSWVEALKPEYHLDAFKLD